MANWTPEHADAEATVVPMTRPHVGDVFARSLRIRLIRLARLGRQLRNERTTK